MAKLHVGDKMPFFTFQTESQSGLTTESVLRNGRTVFWVLRYIGCTTCRYDIHQIAAYYEEFQKRGVQVYVVMQSDPAVVREDLKDSPLLPLRQKKRECRLCQRILLNWRQKNKR